MFNNNKGFYDEVIIETPEEKEEKKKQQRRQFSRVFLGLILYLAASTLAITVFQLVYMKINGKEAAAVFLNTGWVQLVLSSAGQYLVGFPVFLLFTLGMRRSSTTASEKKRISPRDFFFLLVICYLFMYVGSLISSSVSSFFSSIFGKAPDDSTTAIIESSPIWLIFICTVILAPIFEELIFRKIMIDRFSVFGDKMAIIFSAVAFGIFHGNFYQVFYAVLVGLALGYVYTSTRNVIYPIAIHMIMNFLGSVAVMPVEKLLDELNTMLYLMQTGHDFDLIRLLFAASAVMLYSAMQTGMVVGGGVALTHFIRQKKIKISNDKDIYIKDGEIVKNGIVNTGAVIFIIFCAAEMILTLF